MKKPMKKTDKTATPEQTALSFFAAHLDELKWAYRYSDDRSRIISGFNLEGELAENAQDGIERNIANFALDVLGAPQGMAMTNLQGIITDANPALESLVADEKARILGRRLAREQDHHFAAQGVGVEFGSRRCLEQIGSLQEGRFVSHSWTVQAGGLVWEATREQGRRGY